jgi:hypothetical protein
MEAGSKVKVYLGNVAACYGVATGRAKKVNKVTIYELQECEPFDTWDADYFRDATDVSFDTKFAKEIKTYNNGKRVYLNTGNVQLLQDEKGML